MARKIPVDFDVRTIDLDPNESRIRDEFRLDITNWVKFRHTINIGIHATVLSSPTRPIPNHVEQAYIELGKSHSEVITSLGSAKLSLDLAIESHPNIESPRPSTLEAAARAERNSPPEDDRSRNAEVGARGCPLLVVKRRSQLIGIK